MRVRTETKLSSKLRDLRLAAGLTQVELAKKAGTDHSTISYIESGRIKRPSAEVILAIAHALDLSEDVLFTAAGYKMTGKEQPKVEATLGAEIYKLGELDESDQRFLAQMIRALLERKRHRESKVHEHVNSA